MKDFKIGDVRPRNKVILAPMSEYTDRSFRKLCVGFDAGLAFTEMIHATRLAHGNPKTMDIARVDDGPTVYQLVGSNIDHMRSAAITLESKGAGLIDLNMGCPDSELKTAGAGVYLSTDIDKARKIARAVVEAVKVPVTAKIRLGVNRETINFMRLGKALEEAGVLAITLHPRTGTQRLTGPSYWQYIKELKQALDIPVIGNGDIMSLEDAIEMLRATRCDAVMIGRGAIRNPYIFRQVATYLADRRTLPPQRFREKARTVMDHAKMLINDKGQGLGMTWVRRFLPFYMQDFKTPSDMNRFVKGVTTMKALEDALDRIGALNSVSEQRGGR